MKLFNFRKKNTVEKVESADSPQNTIFKSQTPPPTNIQVNAVVNNKIGWLLKLLIVFLLLGILVASGVIVYIKIKRTPVQVIETVRQVETDEKSKSEIEEEQLKSVQKSPKEIDLLTNEVTADIESIPIKYNFEGYNVLNPRILELKKDGVVNKVDDPKMNDLISLAQSKGVNIIPVLYINYNSKAEDRARLEKLNYDKLVNDIYTIITSNNYAGISLDHTLITDRKIFENLVKDLSARLKKDNKILKLTLAAKWGSELYYGPYLNYSPYYYFNLNLKDYQQYFDEVTINAFDYTTPFSSLAGPISDIDWVEKVIQYTISQNVSRDKIVIGINANGYDWVNREFEVDFKSNFSVTDKQAKVLTSGAIDSLLAVVSDIPEVKTNGDSILNYTLENKTHTLVYPTKAYKLEIKNLAAEYGVKGISYNGF